MKGERNFKVDLHGNAEEQDPERNGYGEPQWLSFLYKVKVLLNEGRTALPAELGRVVMTT